MRIYLVRHAVAVPRHAPGIVDDASRELTPQGASRMRRAVRGLVKLKISPERIWSSAYIRCRQTADILAQAFPDAGAVRTLRGLAPGGSLGQVVAILSENTSLREVALVGHEPDLGELASRLLGLSTPVLRFKKGGVACIQIEQFASPPAGELCWLLTPRQLRAMA
jgi:phosphohistidine phosphatase